MLFPFDKMSVTEAHRRYGWKGVIVEAVAFLLGLVFLSLTVFPLFGPALAPWLGLLCGLFFPTGHVAHYLFERRRK